MTLHQPDEALPEFCAARDLVTGDPILIKRGECGYWAGVPGGDPNEFNRRLSVTPAQREAMVIGSMFGWHVPGAQLATWINRKHLPETV